MSTGPSHAETQRRCCAPRSPSSTSTRGRATTAVRPSSRPTCVRGSRQPSRSRGGSAPARRLSCIAGLLAASSFSPASTSVATNRTRAQPTTASSARCCAERCTKCRRPESAERFPTNQICLKHSMRPGSAVHAAQARKIALVAVILQLDVVVARLARLDVVVVLDRMVDGHQDEVNGVLVRRVKAHEVDHPVVTDHRADRVRERRAARVKARIGRELCDQLLDRRVEVPVDVAL
mmetsp:Transcript_13662/g.42743  ORF Transcript_13662/g.42743 Transcript_13662/m.42743 type:complete len:235 (+) Transcript_13662:95-799(+)